MNNNIVNGNNNGKISLKEILNPRVVDVLMPTLLVFSIIILSIFSSHVLNGVIYLAFIIVIVLIRYVLLQKLNTPIKSDNNLNQNIPLPYPLVVGSTYIIIFTMMYIIGPMIMSSNINYFVLSFLLLYLVVNIGLTLLNVIGKDRIKDIIPSFVLDILGGFTFGMIISMIMYSQSQSRSFLFINETSSNTEVCSIPKKQSFKCSVYKNGELVSSSING